ncbi:hypothetical protein CsSME_00033478 [Camellia sinensis var. sinensis]
MTLVFFRRGSTTFTPMVNSCFQRVFGFSTWASNFLDSENGATESWSVHDKGIASENDSSGLHLSPLFSHGRAHLENYKIEVVDAEAWRVSSGLVEACRGMDRESERKGLVVETVDEMGSSAPSNKDDPDFDDIEDMRIRGHLFYKLDRDSKEFEEHSFDFHRKKSLKNESDQKESTKKKISNPGVDKSLKTKEERKESKKKENPIYKLASRSEGLAKLVKNEAFISSLRENDSYGVTKKVRTLTFNQLTAPYHEPFCLDIYISKGSVRACIIHRATSKVVAVAHSISKDMKFDLASTKNATACTAVGEVLAQRALADDIHNAVYTPRKGEKLEGKLQIVLQAITDNGVNVKVKIKRRKVKKAWQSATA